MSKSFTIGTRGSLLAVTQCSLIKEEIEKKTKAKFDLKKIKTQGDQITDKPLWQLEGKDFFTKELDEALLEQSIDLVVHSYKDLGSIRPEGIELACITKRDYAHDVLLIKKETIKELSQKSIIVVGTSSPRRIYNLQNNLSRYLPGDNTKVECKTLRGNINTRIKKLKNDQYDAIVLAMAGLERLACHEESKETLKELLDGLNFMIMPQKDFPSAASQGALAIECNDKRQDDLKEILKTVHNDQTAQEIQRERAAFKKYGGGCHLPVGIHVKSVHDFFIHLHEGESDGTRFKRSILEGFNYPKNLYGKKAYYMFGQYDFLIKKRKIKNAIKGLPNIFLTSSLCQHNLKAYTTLWSAGNRTMKKLIKSGQWVNGSAEGFGHNEIVKFQKSEFIKIMSAELPWIVLSHDKAKSPVGDVVASYKHEVQTKFQKKYKDELMDSEIIYWSSPLQFELYTTHYPELLKKYHACGLGKTYLSLKDKDINLIPCIDMNHLENIVRTPNE